MTTINMDYTAYISFDIKHWMNTESFTTLPSFPEEI